MHWFEIFFPFNALLDIRGLGQRLYNINYYYLLGNFLHFEIECDLRIQMELN